MICGSCGCRVSPGVCLGCGRFGKTVIVGIDAVVSVAVVGVLVIVLMIIVIFVLVVSLW